jgi:hypothetical protein
MAWTSWRASRTMGRIVFQAPLRRNFPFDEQEALCPPSQRSAAGSVSGISLVARPSERDLALRTFWHLISPSRSTLAVPLAAAGICSLRSNPPKFLSSSHCHNEFGRYLGSPIHSLFCIFPLPFSFLLLYAKHVAFRRRMQNN